METKLRTVGVRFIQSTGHTKAKLVDFNEERCINTGLSNKTYSYYTPYKDHGIGDLVMVQVGTEYKVVIVTDLKPDNCMASRWICGKVSVEDTARLRMRAVKKARLSDKMEAYYADQVKYARWDKLVTRDKVFRKMYKKWLKM